MVNIGVTQRLLKAPDQLARLLVGKAGGSHPPTRGGSRATDSVHMEPGCGERDARTANQEF